ncbi:MAG: toxin-antitoxin system protein [Oscillibacter sp.]|uniref:toxin-antitoxin system protein n=1 Tax=uncultured Oscillibacter sp. TaxID=876091 RepID=UPI00216DB3E7|nr:toxin-antitoxin system protein [uncultured Oscillibacter sp.]MCI8802906.1 toxin-antitoxin system protein [Oscillibacter sp.]
MESYKPLKVKVSLSLDEEVVKKLRILAEEDDRQLSSYVNLVLRNYLRKLETEKRDGP